MDKSSMDNRTLRKIAGILWCPDLKRNIIILIVFFLVYLALGSATGINTSSPGESADILNESLLSQDETFSFGTLNILDGNNNALFCSVTFYDNAGILKVSDFTNTLSIEKINPGSHLNIESNDNNILLDFSINGDSFDPVVRIADYGISNPTSNSELHGSPLKYISVDASNLSYSNLRMAISYSGMDEDIDTSKLKIFKYVETFAYNEWIELPTHVDELNQAVWTDVDSTSIFAVSITDSTAHPQNITIGDVSLFNSIGIPQPGEITISDPEGNFIAGSVGTLTLDEAPSGSYLNINSSETNTRLDFTLHADSSNPVILLEDFGTNNPAGDYLPPGEPVKYLMVGAENLGYAGVNLTLYYPDISGNFSIFRLSETFAYNEWEELSVVVDTSNNTITTSLDTLSIFALSKITPVGVRVLDNTNALLTVEIKTYDNNENPEIVKRGHTLSVDELPRPGYIAIDALVEKDVAVVFKSSYSSGGEIVLDNYARHNPEAIDPNRMPVKFVEIHARNLIFDSADIEIHYSDDEIGSLDENKLQISHFSGGAWVTLDSTVDPVNNMVRASTDSLSTFALVYNGTSVNTKKSIYRPGEMAEIMIVVLDSAGAPVSDGSIRMNVTAPEGSVEYFSTVTGSIAETSDPGVYEAAYLTGGEGRYNISCTAIIEGSESRFDTYFMVLSEYDFDIIRHAQGKIDPTKYDTFDVGLDIISYTDAGSIIIWEYVPADFEVYTDASVVEADNLKVLTWQRSLVNNRTSVNYSYSVPMEWPKLYQMGPVEIDYGHETLTEARSWWVAVDPMFDYIVNGDFSSGSGTDAYNWTESYDSDATTELNSGNMYMYTPSSGSSLSDRNGYADQNFSYNYNTPPTSAYLNFDWYRDVNYGVANVYVELKQPGSGNFVTLWSNTSTEEGWNTVSDLDIKEYINTTGDYTFRLHAVLSRDNQNDPYARVRWDNVSLNITGTGDYNTSPSIYNVESSGVTRSQAHIRWDTTQSDSNNTVKYSVHSELSVHNWSDWDNNTDSVHIPLTNLSPSTKYYYSAYSYNGTNNSLYSNSSIYNFTTAGNVTAQGNVKDKIGPLTCEITVYNEDGSTVLNSTNRNSFNLNAVPVGGYIQFDANSSKDVLAKFKISGNSSNAVITLEDYGLDNPESTEAPMNPMKYVDVSATNLSYENVEIKIYYSDAELGSRNENSLKIYHYIDGAWKNLPTTVDAANNILTVQTSSLSTFAASDATVFEFSISPTTAVNNTETRFTLTTTNTDSDNDMENVTINCTLPPGWKINDTSISNDGTNNSNTITWDGGITIQSLASIDRTFNATYLAGENYNFTCNGTGTATAHQLQNWDFSSGSGTNADYWVESKTGQTIIQWDNLNENMHMYVYGAYQVGNGYCNQSFAYSGPDTPTSAVLNFSWNFDQNNGGTDLYVNLTDPDENTNMIWSESLSVDNVWTDESIDITSNISRNGTYTLSLHAVLDSGMGGSSDSHTRWDNASIVITNSYSNEENITISIPLSVSISAITTNKTSYSAGELVAINTTVNNTGGDDVIGNLNLSIRYINGTILDTVESYLNMLIPYDQSNITTTTWNTTTTPVGNYLAYAEFNYTNQAGGPVSTTNQTAFSIAGDLDVTVDANGPYNLADNLTINIIGTVTESSIGVSSANVNITIYDKNNTCVNQTNITTNAGGTYEASLIIPLPVLGTYTADVRADNNTQEEGVGFDTFKIAQLSVTAIPDKDAITPTEVIVIEGVVSDAETSDFVESAEVTVTIYNSTLVQVDTKSTTTSTDGSYSTAFIAPNTEGIYYVNVSAVESGINGTSETQFNVSTITSMTLYLATDKAVYLLDPYKWVYEAPYASTNEVTEFEGGHGQNVTLDVMVLNQQGHLVPNATISYTVSNLSGIQISGTANETRTGFYQDIFIVNETIIKDEAATIMVTAEYDTVTADNSLVFQVKRWGCDGCHQAITAGMVHSNDWSEMIGSLTETEGSVNYSNLIDYELTHTPSPGSSSAKTNHESISDKGCGGACHPGLIKCTQCHTGYLLGIHENVVQSSAPSTSCANTSCHGHINEDTLPGDLDNRYPNCSDCHQISYLDGSITTPVWFQNNNDTRNPGIHPGGTDMNESVNCSFCHYSFHRIQAETWTLNNRNCTSCHTNAGVFTNHSYDNVTCAGCHQFSGDSDKWHQWYGSTSKLDYHNITKPSCLTCHPGYDNHSSYQTSGVSCSQCHNNEPIYSYEGSVMRTGATFVADTSIHSIYNDTSVSPSLIPDCTACHDTGYANHSLYDTYGVYCTYCHNNATLNYSGSILPANTTYNTDTAIHTLSAAQMKPSCMPCHYNKNNHTSYNTTGVICIQCHNNATLNYTGTKMYSAEYNTGTTVHTTNTTPASSDTLSPLCTTCHTKTGDEIETGYDNYAMNNDSNNLAPSGSNMTHKRDTITGTEWGTDPPDGNVRYARHANPDSSGGWPGATGTAREPNQICINCHSERIRYWGIVNENTWDIDDNQHCEPCHSLWADATKPDAHKLSIPYCTDCHGQLNDPDSIDHGPIIPFNDDEECIYCHISGGAPFEHRNENLLDPPKDYTLTPSIGMMLNDSAHNRMILNTSTNHPTNDTGCIVCHTTVTFTANSTPDTLTINITDHSGAHTWNSKPNCTKCHSIDLEEDRPGPYPNAHELLNIDWGNNTQCLKCHNIYNQTVDRYHGHEVNTESCTACHYNYTAMNDYGKPSVYVNETMYESSVHGTEPGANCSQCHTNYHPPPEYTWKWCECCHSYQSDPISETDRHNVTADPLSYNVTVDGTSTPVLNITDCTDCHNATQYNTSKETFNRTSGKDCRYCHTYPDQTYD